MAIPLWFFKYLSISLIVACILAVVWASYLMWKALTTQIEANKQWGWLEYPENKPEESGYYWITLRVRYIRGESYKVFLASANQKGDFFYIGMDGMDINEDDDGEVVAFMPIGAKPAPFMRGN